jgi:hypothetical protein
MSKQIAWVLIIIGLWLILLGGYIVSQNPIYGTTTGGPLVTIGYNWTGFWVFSVPGIILVIVAIWQAIKNKKE